MEMGMVLELRRRYARGDVTGGSAGVVAARREGAWRRVLMAWGYAMMNRQVLVDEGG